MALINLTYRIRGSEEESQACGLEKIQELLEKLKPGLDLVKKSCEEKFPDLCVRWTVPKEVIFDEIEEGVWDAMAWLEIKTMYAVSTSNIDFEVDQHIRWKMMKKPLGKDVVEYLYEADWSLIKPLCQGDSETLGEVLSVEFSAVKAVESYSGNGLHFYDETYYL